MKRIGLAIAAALLGTTSVASAGIALVQFTSSNSSSSQSASLDAQTEKLAANCWVAVGGSSASSCNTGGASAAASGLPGLSALDKATGLVDAGPLVATAHEVAAGVAGKATGLAASAAGT